MELNSGDETGSNHGYEVVIAVDRSSSHDGLVSGFDDVAVHEIERTPTPDAAEERLGLVLDIVPSHMREWVSAEGSHRALEDSETRIAVLIRVVEQELHADAHPKQWPAVANEGLNEALSAQRPHRGAGRSHAG
jgi:maltooligosyltrehalose synthase